MLVPLNDPAALAAALERRDVAVVLTEPALTNNFGLILPDPGFHAELRRLTRDTGTLLAIDETHTQVVGPGGLTAAWGLDPDFVTCGKSIAGGVPFGAWGMTDEIAAVLEQAQGTRWRALEPRRDRRNAVRQRAVAGRRPGDDARDPDARGLRAHPAARVPGWPTGCAPRSSGLGLPWHIYRLGPRAGYTFQPEPLRNADEARGRQDDLLTRLIRIWLANRGVWEAIVGAGPVCSVPADRRGRRRLPRRLERAARRPGRLSPRRPAPIGR